MVHPFLKGLTRSKNGDLLSRDFDDLFRILGITPLSCCSLLDLESSKPYDLDFISFCKGLLNRFEKTIDHFRDFLFGKSLYRFCQNVNKVSLRQLPSPPPKMVKPKKMRTSLTLCHYYSSFHAWSRGWTKKISFFAAKKV